MNARGSDLVALAVISTVLTLVLAAPVVQAPSERIFGRETVGRHHDPFTVMAQFERSGAAVASLQPVTDLPGSYLARQIGSVAAYNVIVLLSFPLSALAAYLLARHFELPRVAAGLAALMFAFSPFHLAHAAYHQHIAQTQWLPLYLLALWRCLDAATTRSVALLVAAALTVVLSNFYGGLIAATITPVSLAAYWWSRTRKASRSSVNLTVTVVALGAVAAAGALAVASQEVLAQGLAFAFPRSDVARFSASWWSYLMPPVAHPFLGSASERLWISRGVGEGLLEQQVSVGWAASALAGVALWAWWRRIESSEPGRAAAGHGAASVPVLAAVALWACLCSLTLPSGSMGSMRVAGVSDLLYPIVPMFRAYARFGVIVQLMVALLAAIGTSWLWQRRSLGPRVACGALVLCTGAEYAVWPPAMSRDVLPTQAHRWVVARPGPLHVLDCAALTPDAASVPWLTRRRVDIRHAGLVACADPDIGRHALARGYTHLIVRRPSSDDRLFAQTYLPDGLRTVVAFPDSVVLSVAKLQPPVHTAATRGFFAPERGQRGTWRWMGREASWVVVNPGTRPARVSGTVEMTSFAGSRHVRVLVDGYDVQMLAIDGRHVVTIGPLTIGAGRHEVTLHVVEAPTTADEYLHNGDRRGLTVAVGDWRWSVAEPPTS